MSLSEDKWNGASPWRQLPWGISAFALRAAVGLVVFFVALLGLFHAARVPCRSLFGYPETLNLTCIERAWYWVWTTMEVYDFSPKPVAIGGWRWPRATVLAPPRVPGWLLPLHHILVDVSYVGPPAVLAIACYSLLARRFHVPHCRHCGRRLRRLRSAHCPACGGPL